jgi:ribonucleotide reductase beta subunit family protein with ferritin-like domain
MDFVKEALQFDIIGMNATLMCQYVQFVADVLIFKILGYKHYNIQNPFEWMDMISMQGKANFFEKRVSDYKKAKVGLRPEDLEFRTDVDF